MKKPFLLACLAIFLCCTSCSNDDDTTVVEDDGGIYALKVGNSWVYHHFERENPQSEVFNDVSVIDSVNIVGTEEINGNVFFKFRRRTSGNESNIAFCSPNGEHFEYLRDSLGYLINDSGKVQFAPVGDTTEHILQMYTNDRLIFQRSDASEMINTPAGDFDCYYMNLYTRTNAEDERSIGTSKYYRMDGVGEVFTTSSWASRPLHTIEKRLISYELQ
ncbi:hypothetical protein KORDIASMS9_00100 [Kordia sp. SMS9]|uniref:hypothetical protein n=1 Tax=Kordia sp. SMS9 TaxID=2282170 RepID=UPI000E0D2049|nr:hypothetical protein [Kordia sp. SMS9]AXG67918.1 hypothetical protein KORDIASMS9_00100 [Kordia sp. SMS9]